MFEDNIQYSRFCRGREVRVTIEFPKESDQAAEQGIKDRLKEIYLSKKAFLFSGSEDEEESKDE